MLFRSGSALGPNVSHAWRALQKCPRATTALTLYPSASLNPNPARSALRPNVSRREVKRVEKLNAGLLYRTVAYILLYISPLTLICHSHSITITSYSNTYSDRESYSLHVLWLTLPVSVRPQVRFLKQRDSHPRLSC